MKIAVPYEAGQIFQHFGHTACFKLYEAENGKITGEQLADTAGCGHGALAGFLKSAGVDTLICGGIGLGAKNALDDAGIKLYGGISGSADEAVHALLSGTFSYDPNACCTHHEHDCGSHGCGEHTCGHHCG